MVDGQAPSYDYEKFNDFCGRVLGCGHSCLGVAGEQDCLPCINNGCLNGKANQVALEPQDVQPQDLVFEP